MALNSMLRRATSSVLPLAIRATVGSSRSFHSVISTAQKVKLGHALTQKSFSPFLRFSTAAAVSKTSQDESLIRILESEIDCAQKDNLEYFGITALPDEICIDSLSIKLPDASEDQLAYEGPDFNDLDENLQKAFHKYLEIRGIKPSTTNTLREYMDIKESNEYLLWLKNIKKFIEK
ncbi:uncharacterized protein CFP56_009257 [Quercus suber]|uniref:Mitochondrial glycoprotein n=1 Tax=Quercus suber TaxID=58331 RepID=A0AAW0L2P0_QUESU